MRKTWESTCNWFADHVVLFAIAWLLIGLVLFIVYSVITWRWGDLHALDWRAITAFATWFLAGGVYLAFSQIREARRSTNAQLATDLFRMLRSEQLKKTGDLIYRLRPDDIRRLCESSYESNNTSVRNLKDEINGLLDKYEMLGSLVNRHIIDESLAIEAYGGVPALKCWYKLVAYIRIETCKRGYFLPNYEAFTRRCLEYFHDKHIEVNFYEEADGTKNPLVTLFTLDSSLRPRNLKKIQKDRDC